MSFLAPLMAFFYSFHDKDTHDTEDYIDRIVIFTVNQIYLIVRAYEPFVKL